jgi:transposase
VLTLPPSVKIYMATEAVDLRRGHDGLGAIVRTQWELDVYAGHLFVFLGRRLDRCKILFFDQGGFVLYYKRLERGRFRLPRVTEEAQVVKLDATQLEMLLDGIDFGRVRRPRHWQPPSAPGRRPSRPSAPRLGRRSHPVRHRSDAPT